jgi:hypothetical protein
MDLQHRELLRLYFAGDDAAGHQAAKHAFRSGLTLSQIKDSGLPWDIVKDYIYLLNGTILSPEECREYKNYLLLNTNSHPKFVEQQEFFVRTTYAKVWYPNWPKRMLSMNIAFYDDRAYLHNQMGPKMKISFWGRDDAGVEIYMQGPNELGQTPLDVLDSILRDLPFRVTKDWLLRNGFNRA